MTSHVYSLSLCLFCFSYLTQQTFQLGKGLPSGRKKGLRRRRQALTGKAGRGVGKMLRRFYPNWVEKANEQTFQLQESGDGSQKQGVN
ncbi:hypothetical protein [Aeromonas bestiarum]|uniref:hypothetical protein n=1 Tax=Aeromonas bestiarum TaxID=105751 RepID=UPI0011AEEB5F|nr:hypothetical protein [Aeromonas bestiarum]